MADEPIVAAPVPAPVVAPAVAAPAAPVAAAPAPVPVSVATPEAKAAPTLIPSEPAITPVAAAAVVESPIPIVAPDASPEAAAADPAITPSLLTEAVKPIADEPAPAPDAPPLEAPVVTYEPFQAPEGITLDPKEVTPFTDILAKHKAPQELGQELINLALERDQKTREALSKAQHDGWHQTRTDWADEVRADPEMGGARLQTTLTRCSQVIDKFAGDPVAFRDMLKLTGTDNHPAMVRFLNNLGPKVLEPTEIVRPTKAMSLPVTKAQRRYSNMNGAS